MKQYITFQKMHTAKYVQQLLIYVVCLLLAACSDYLNREPWDSINTSKGIQTSEDLVALVNAAYQPMQWAKLYNMRIWTLDIMAGNSVVGAGGGTDGIETVDLANFTTTTDNFAALDLFRGPSPGILRCNYVLRCLDNMSNIDTDIRNRSIGEVKFLRAHYYFLLVRLFGAVPLMTEPLSSGDELTLPRTAVDSVYNLIISDLKEAAELLPAKASYSNADVGRATREAAIAELARVYLTRRENYGEIVNLCDQITALGYALNTDYSDNFNPEKKNGVESIFEVQYYGKTNYDFWSNENQASWLSVFTGPRNSNMVAGGYGWNQPTGEFVSQYETGDLRKDQTILYLGCPTFDGKQYQSSYSTTGYNLRKFLVNKNISSDYNTSPANWVITRYAEVLLMKAEALNEQGFTTLAEAPLYEVRQRAGLTDRSTIEGLNQKQMREKIMHERRMELAFEGQRWFDLIRMPDNYALTFLHSIGKSNAREKHLLLPIPLKEMEANGKLTQNPGY